MFFPLRLAVVALGALAAVLAEVVVHEVGGGGLGARPAVLTGARDALVRVAAGLAVPAGRAAAPVGAPLAGLRLSGLGHANGRALGTVAGIVARQRAVS